MSWSKANKWDTDIARTFASGVASVGGYCGPAVVAWIAAVWNHSKGRGYDYQTRLRDKSLFADGPRAFIGHSDVPGWQTSLNAILKRETNNELKLSDETHYRYGAIHGELEEHDMPIIIRMMGPQFIGSLHYVTLYKSQKEVRDWSFDRIQFYWQDNGVYGKLNGGNRGLYTTDWRKVGQSMFVYGAKRVRKA